MGQVFPAKEHARLEVVAVPAFQRVEDGEFEGRLVVCVLYGEDSSFDSRPALGVFGHGLSPCNSDAPNELELF